MLIKYLVVFATLMLMGAQSFSHVLAQDAIPTLDPALEDCRALMVDPPPLEANAPRLRILEPLSDTVFYGDQLNMQIVAENFALTDGGHWHIWVDGVLTGMVYEARTFLNLAPGTYRICANLGDGDHLDMGIPDGITITVMAAGAGTPTSTPFSTPSPNEAPISAPLPEGGVVSNPLVIVLMGVGAAVGGILAGSLMGRRGKKK